LVEAADDICYHIIDLEDGFTLGLIDEELTANLLIEIVGETFDKEKYGHIATSQERIGMLRALAINNLVDQATTIFLDAEDDILEGNFDRALIELCPSYPVLKQIIDISIQKLYRSKIVVEIEAAGFEVLSGLIERFSEAMIATINEEATAREETIWNLLPESTQQLKNKTDCTTYEILRACLDYISGMTDSAAISLYRKINGISLPGF
jgi:dGTPase